MSARESLRLGSQRDAGGLAADEDDGGAAAVARVRTAGDHATGNSVVRPAAGDSSDSGTRHTNRANADPNSERSMMLLAPMGAGVRLPATTFLAYTSARGSRFACTHVLTGDCGDSTE